MAKQKKQQLIWVHPNFKTQVKVQAAAKGLSVLEFTKQITLDDIAADFENQKKKKRGNKFELSF